eukprot:scaffold177683_cov66-Cyclotella_meneghiniana.AAC.6
MFFDEALTQSIRRIGTLGLHEAIVSDHVMLYADIDEKELFQTQADKCEKFLKEDRKLTKDVPNQVDKIINNFRSNGSTYQAIEEYNNLDKTIYEALIAAAKRTIHKKSGYKRSPDLGEAGLKVNFWKSIKSSIYRRSPPPPATFKIAEKLQVNINEAMSMSKNAALKQVHKMVQELRAVQRGHHNTTKNG